ncbi:MAG: ABC transporter ATP-binding protein [Sulfuricurvum sp.]|jgi:capsular polysaccharide transport system ATP-binding protein|uniref:ABC transporter ATP-binding protein n=1 Tax=Sulfuricurvum sp. TaxID=2025608 RepID=UPI0025F4D46C|nr:ABC transporter ATP-binding protein [Sulfuricurvum sp.]MCI4406652.1 ABC transporter ATP-binding protein [Sulfuricurvum sp.]
MLELKNICKSYPIHHGKSERLILDHVNFRIERGEKWGILGRNGVGKSTLIRIISGSDLPQSGSVTSDMSISWPLAFGGAFQGSLTGRDNVKLISRIYGVDFHRTLELVEDFAELGAYLNEPVKSYSSGMSARLAFAISMSVEFDCFLIDEGMSVGDHRFHRKCDIELFEKRGDRAMIIVAHQVDLIRAHCDHAAVLDKGHLIICDSVDDAIRMYEG